MLRFDVDRFNHLSDEERFERIAALVANAVVLTCGDARLNEKCSPEGASVIVAPAGDVSDLVSDNTEKQILSYLERVSSATPLNFRATLGLSRQSVARKLARLRAAGLVVVTGKTRLARYELAGQGGSN